MALHHGDTILFIGDSITDADRLVAGNRPFGFGYVHFVAYRLLAMYPQLELEILNRGISGNNVKDLEARWQEDCLELEPNVLSIMIGINDLWRQHAEPEHLPFAVYPEDYERIYRNLLVQSVARSKPRIVLMEPFMFCSDKNNEMLQGLDAYLKIVRKLADEFDAQLVPLQQQAEKMLECVPQQRFSDDMVHPFVWAHAWIAEKWFEAVKL